MPEEFTVDANALTFTCLRAGSGDRLALCLHGFPDDAGSMEPLLERLADAGFTAVAPYMRGYGPTDAAPDGDYSSAAIATDAVALTETLCEREDCAEPVLVGHDWGAVATYGAARRAPDLFERLVGMAVPPHFVAAIWRHPRQLLRSWYIALFQFPGLAERTLRRDDFALVEVLWNLWSPGWDYPDERIEAVKETFREGDTVENALAYYRQFVNPLAKQIASGGFPETDDLPPIEVPGLVVTGADDGCIGPDLYAGSQAAFAADADCRVVRVRDAGHFLHQERPAVVGDEVVGYLADGG